ncbi:MAG TPA: CAP domain-containing protein [Sulfurovum sp.]|nr:CAP domain-containing protein [Sulfurovum sp.]
MKNLVFLVFAIVLFGCGGGTPPDNTFVAHPFEDAPVIDEATKQIYLDAINNARSIEQDCGVEGIKPAVSALVWNDALYKSAYEHGKDLAESDTFSHDGSGTDSDWTAEVQGLGRGSTIKERIVNNAYTNWSTLGENVAGGTFQDLAQEAVDAWIASDGHCANLMNPRYKDVGMGHVEQDGTRLTHYWVQNLGAKQ